ncbi:hypothetical protein [Flavobacterium ustbae]|uniref:hypothetical protein n=1 Tax=Flavobacterium ustbae TaxID=2488790 RepID=UPI000F77F9DA|nr:hypothetical protein [Flavobacterium ustbae]
MNTGFWIETNWGESHDNVNKNEITSMLLIFFKIEMPNAVLWIGDNDGMRALEIHKNFNVHYISGENMDQRKSISAQSAEHCSNLVNIFIKSDFMLFINEFYAGHSQIFHLN